MALSVSIVTRDSAVYITPLLQAARQIADEVVVAVECRSQDETEEICRQFADRLIRLEPFGDAVEATLARARAPRRVRPEWTGTSIRSRTLGGDGDRAVDWPALKTASCCV